MLVIPAVGVSSSGSSLSGVSWLEMLGDVRSGLALSGLTLSGLTLSGLSGAEDDGVGMLSCKSGVVVGNFNSL